MSKTLLTYRELGIQSVYGRSENKDGDHQLVPNRDEYLLALESIEKELDRQSDVIDINDTEHVEECRQLFGDIIYSVVNGAFKWNICDGEDVVPMVSIHIEEGVISYSLYTDVSDPEICKAAERRCRTLAELIRNKHAINKKCNQENSDGMSKEDRASKYLDSMADYLGGRRL